MWSPNNGINDVDNLNLDNLAVRPFSQMFIYVYGYCEAFTCRHTIICLTIMQPQIDICSSIIMWSVTSRAYCRHVVIGFEGRFRAASVRYIG